MVAATPVNSDGTSSLRFTSRILYHTDVRPPYWDAKYVGPLACGSTGKASPSGWKA